MNLGYKEPDWLGVYGCEGERGEEGQRDESSNWFEVVRNCDGIL